MPSQIESRTHDPVAATASASAQALLSMRGITKSYGDHVVLNHIDLDVASREKVAVIGPSGSGKTTILRAAIGLVKPDEGTIRIDGEYLWQRVAIARSLALRPKIMLFDEVTSALDPELVGEVLRVVRQLASEGEMSMLIVTHEISFAADIADRVLMFDAGKIVEQGPPSQVLKNPTNPRTRQFLRAVLER